MVQDIQESRRIMKWLRRYVQSSMVDGIMLAVVHYQARKGMLRQANRIHYYVHIDPHAGEAKGEELQERRSMSITKKN